MTRSPHHYLRSIRRRSPARQTIGRIAFALIILLAGLPLVQEYVLAAGIGGIHPTAPPNEHATVIASQNGHLLLYGPNGTLQYDEHTYDRYWDVDPHPAGNRTVLYVASEDAPGSCADTDCQRNVVVRTNLTTGERTQLFARTFSTKGSNEWHDIDRINDTHIVVAGIKRDRVFTVDTTSDRITWQWNASEFFAPDSGGPPDDWTHLNDVEYTQNGRVMVSIRNQDQIVFIEPGNGVLENRTLGTEGNFSILRGQHNPDYIPKSQGGPAVLVADSHNNRAVEYQWENGTWVRTWQWTDNRLQWPRDVDRLPNGNTLITDSNGDRVLEVNESGRIVWSVSVEKPYEAERLSTGDESAGGQSAAALGLTSRTDGTTEASGLQSGVSDRLWQVISDVAPAFAFNSLLFVLPGWMTPNDLLLALVVALASLLWVGCELQWRTIRPIKLLQRARKR